MTEQMILTEQIQEGQNYSVFKKCVSISVLDFRLFDGEDYFYSRFNLREDFEMLATKNPYIESAYQQLQVISQDKKKRLEYEARQKAILDYNQGMLEAERRGREAGERIGREAGEYDNKIQTAKNMIKKGFDKKDIIEITGLTAKELDNLFV